MTRWGGSARAPLNLAGKVVLVTGAGRGIGRAASQRLHARGALVALLDADESAAKDVVAHLGDERSCALPCDVRDAGNVTEAVGQVVQRWGRVDVVVVNAGISPPTATLRVIDPEALTRVIDTNLLGAWHTVRAGLEQIIAHRGHISVISSCAAFTPGMGGAPYMMSKAAVEQLGRALRIELAMHGATAGVISFGIVETAMARRTLDEDDLGRQVGRLLPWPLNRRISAPDAANVICRSIERRQARCVAPRTWLPYAVLRGAVNPLLDDVLSAHPRVHALLRDIEQRAAAP